MHFKWPHELHADWQRFLSAARRPSSAALNVLLIFTYSHRSSFLDNQGNRKRSPQKVRDKGGLWTGRFWPIPINSPQTSWKLPPVAKIFVSLDWHATVVSFSGTVVTAYRNGPFSVFSYSHNFFSSESELSENVFTIESQYQTDGFCP